MELKRKANLYEASCDGVSQSFYLALLAIFASPSTCIKLYGYCFDNIVSTKICFPDHSTKCDYKFRVSKTIEKESLIYAEVQPEIKIESACLKRHILCLHLKKVTYLSMSVFSQKNQDY